MHWLALQRAKIDHFAMKSAVTLILMLSVVGYSLRFCERRAMQSIFRPSARLLRLSFSTTSFASTDIDSMSLKELKDKLKAFGGKPGSLKKAEIAAEIKKLQAESSLTPHLPAIEERQPKETVISKSEVLNLSSSVRLLQQTNMVSRKITNQSTAVSENEEPKQTEYTTRSTRHPVGNRRDERLAHIVNTEMELTFLGTASCIPSASRGVSCVAMRYIRDIWLFDCGESSQVQLQSSRILISKIKKIFITHSHGDHCFGLPGVLCLLGQSHRDRELVLSIDGDDTTVIDIYGPEGIRDYIRACMQLSFSRATVAYRVHELKRVPYLHGRYQRQSVTNPVLTRYDPRYGEREGGRDIFPDQAGIYHLLDEDMLCVRAAPMQHSVPCVGFVVEEKEREGKLRIDLVRDLVEKHKDYFEKIPEFEDQYRKAFAVLKSLKPGEKFKFPDGTEVDGGDINEPPKVGRKFVYMGDTCNGQYIQPLCYDADIVVHEATNSFNPVADTRNRAQNRTYKALEYDTIAHGHSTPQMAARFAEKVRAKQLILTHFSARYPGDSAEVSMKYMWFIEEQARRECSLKGENDIIAAWDFMSLGIPSPVDTASSRKGKVEEEPSNEVVNASRGYGRKYTPKSSRISAAPGEESR